MGKQQGCAGWEPVHMPIMSFSLDDEVFLSVNVEQVACDLAFIVSQTSFGILPTMLACMASPQNQGPIGTAKILGGACGLIAFAFSPIDQRIQIGRMPKDDPHALATMTPPGAPAH